MCSEQIESDGGAGHDADAPTTAQRLDRLFETFHSRNEPEQPDAGVAAGVSEILGYPVGETAITALRAGGAPTDPLLLGGLARHFGIDETYLTGSSAKVALLHRKLELLAQARDAGLQRLALRGGGAANNDVLDKVLGILDGLHDPDPGRDPGPAPDSSEPAEPTGSARP